MSNAQPKFAWQPGDLKPDWLALVPEDQQRELCRLLAVSAGQQKRVCQMLAVSPWPVTTDEASARVTEVIEFLEGEPT